MRGVADECNVRRDVQHTAPRVGNAEGRKRLFLSARLLSRDGFGMGGGVCWARQVSSSWWDVESEEEDCMPIM